MVLVLSLAIGLGRTPSPSPSHPPVSATCPKQPAEVKPKCPVCPDPRLAADRQAAPVAAPAPPTDLSAKDRRKVRQLLAAGRRAFKARQWKKALQLANQALHLDPSNAQALRLRNAARDR